MFYTPNNVCLACTLNYKDIYPQKKKKKEKEKTHTHTTFPITFKTALIKLFMHTDNSAHNKVHYIK